MYGFIGVIVSVVVLLLDIPGANAKQDIFSLGPLEFFPAKKKKIERKKMIIHWDKETNAPEPLIYLLKNPSEENAKAYLEWVKQKQERIDAVQKIIEKVAHESKK